MTPLRRTQIAISGVAVAFVAARLAWPDLQIDATTVTLLVVAALPWLTPLFKSLELPGGLRVEFQDLQATERRAVEAGLLDEPADSASAQEYSFQVVADRDPNLALAGLRIEIERRLAVLAERAGSSDTKVGVGRLLWWLSDHKVLSRDEQVVLRDMVNLLNSAVHGASVDSQSAEWVLDVGPRLLATLEKRTETHPPC